MTCRLITKMKYFLVLTFTMFTLSDSMPLSSTNVLRVNESSPSTVSNQTSANSSAAGTNPGFSGHRLLRIQAKPRSGYLPTNGTLMIIGDSSMRIFDFNEIMHPKFNPSTFLKQATAESTQKIEVPFNYGQHYFVFLPPALLKEYRLMRSRGRRRFKRHHPSILKNILGALQDYALVPIQSNTGQVRYILLKNPKFVISGVGPSGTPITASIPVTQQPGSLSLVQPGSSSQSQSQDHHSQSQPHHTQNNPKTPAVKSVPSPSQRVLPQIVDIMSPMTIAPTQRRAPPAPRSWAPSRSRTQPLTRNNRPLSASKAKTAVLGDRSDRLERPIPAAGPIDSLFNDNIVPRPAVQMRHVHSHSRGHIQTQSLNPSPNALPRVDMVSHNIQSTGQSASISSSIGSSSSSASGANSISSVDTALGSVSSGTVDNTAPIDGSGTHTVHQTEIVETVIETKNQEAAVAKTDTAAVAANQTTSVSSTGDNSASAASKTSASSAASASSAVAAKQEKVISSKKTIKTTKIKQGTDAQGKPASVHEVTEVVEHTSAAKTDAATATKTDGAAATSSGSTAVVSEGGKSGSTSAESASAAAASSSASVTSNNATATTVKKKTIKKTVVTKTAAAPAAASAPTIDAAAQIITDTSNTLVADSVGGSIHTEGLTVTAVDSSMPPTKKQRKNKKKAKTAILSENNDRQSVGFKAALIPTDRPKIAAKIMEKTTQALQSTPMTTVTEAAGEEQMTTVSPTTEEVELEDILTTTMNPTEIQYSYPISVTTVLPQVAGWAGGPTTNDPALGPLDRINTTDVPEEIEARPDKTPAELRREMAKLNPNLPKNSPVPKARNAAQRTSGQQSRMGQGAGRKGPRRPQGRRQPRKQNVGRRRRLQGRRRNRNSRNNPRFQGSDRGRPGPRPRTRDPLTRWLWNNLETGELFENMPFWMFLK